jgi:putative addiction module killer protein
MLDVRRYVDLTGTDVVGVWLESLNDVKTRARINARIARLAVGNIGDAKTLRGGVFELRIDFGPGYRVYFARIGKSIILLLGGGDKRRQAADIERAVESLRDYLRRNR